MSVWLKGQDQIMRKCNCLHWSTVLRLIDEGAPIAKVGGMWTTTEEFLDAWLASRIEEARRKAMGSAGG